ncbi:hypothetical protein [Helicobacter suis]|uniref:DUF5082 domain-containing protein n=1 Tax=Helicobacter suis TaxID=104628 RepID=A0ABM7KXJ4_9HELI|nr:hypothetical protein [Helicobacter suis]BCD45215.1 hypothetical protein NHP190020_02540 [Helicobacter suis]BCD47054.1 hypothetical protein NHP194003_02580 [Helicobacter suis]BCD48811.1 hypothetical protein NHP194004_02580 [Helicobacter suis]GFK16095.1 hypothetical protein NHP190033_02710 [Helicobacter suis]
MIHYRNTLSYYEQIRHNYLERVIAIKNTLLEQYEGYNQVAGINHTYLKEIATKATANQTYVNAVREEMLKLQNSMSSLENLSNTLSSTVGTINGNIAEVSNAYEKLIACLIKLIY